MKLDNYLNYLIYNVHSLILVAILNVVIFINVINILLLVIRNAMKAMTYDHDMTYGLMTYAMTVSPPPPAFLFLDIFGNGSFFAKTRTGFVAEWCI